MDLADLFKLENLMPQTDRRIKNQNLSEVMSFVNQPDQFQGVTARQPTDEIAQKYMKATGNPWPMVPGEAGADQYAVPRSDMAQKVFNLGELGTGYGNQDINRRNVNATGTEDVPIKGLIESEVNNETDENRMRMQGYHGNIEKMFPGTYSGMDKAEMTMGNVPYQTRFDRGINETGAGLALENIYGGTQVSPTDNINQMKYEAWTAYFGGKSTPEQQRLIGVDRDPLMIQAAQMVNSDFRNMKLTADQKAQKVMELTNTMRDSMNQGGTQSDPLGIR